MTLHSMLFEIRVNIFLVYNQDKSFTILHSQTSYVLTICLGVSNDIFFIITTFQSAEERNASYVHVKIYIKNNFEGGGNSILSYPISVTHNNTSVHGWGYCSSATDREHGCLIIKCYI